MKRWILVLAPSAFALGVFSGCASRDAKPPVEIESARQEYIRAQSGAAAQHNPSGLIGAREALDEAYEKYDEGSDEANDYVYVAKRKAQIAEVDGRTSAAVLNSAELQKAEAAKHKAMAEKEMAAAETSERRAKVALDRLGLAAVDEARGTVITLPSANMFATNKAEIRPEAKKRLTEIAEAVKQVVSEGGAQATGRKLLLIGYTDDTGSAEHNLDLSRRRADAVRTFFSKHGLDEAMLETDGRGEADPVADNTTEEGRAQNRRVEVVITRPPGALPTESMPQ